jgi:hypothetical protein
MQDRIALLLWTQRELGRSTPALDFAFVAMADNLAELERVGAIFAPYSVFTYLCDQAAQLAFLSWARAALAPGGCFACDLFVPHYPLLLEPEDRILRDYRRTCADGTVLERSKTIRKDPTNQRNTIRRHYLHRTAGGRVLAHFVTEETIRYVFQPEMAALLAAAGFGIERALGDFAGRPYRYDAAMMVFVARRQTRG